MAAARGESAVATGGVATGLDRLLAGEVPALSGRPAALIANPTTVDRALRSGVDRLAADPAVPLVSLLGPEHGIRGDAQDMIPVSGARDPATGLPVFSLYGAHEASLSPPPEALDGVELIVFDIQDVGARYYTYVWTMVLCMRAAAEAGIAFAVLDRPNPLGGVAVEGGAVEPACRSFVGLMSVPNRHGMTAAEIAKMAVARDGLDLELHVVPMRGWSRGMYFEDTGLPWVMPSPNMPTRDTALVYPGMCLVEGTELSEGRGTTRPFELVGAPFIDGAALSAALDRYELPAVQFRPVTFTPMFQKHAGQPCGGVQLHVTDREAFRPYLTGVALLRAVYALWPEAMQWRRRAYEFVADVPAIDLLAGSSALRTGIEAGAEVAQLADGWAADERAFIDEREAWLLYP